MHAAPALLELQGQFMTALYAGDAVAADTIAGNGLEPAARLRIYQHSSEAIHTAALRTTYPAVLALVGEAFFDQSARGYRRVHASRSGNLQAFGATFADYLQTLPNLRTLAYLSDVARLEWLRQESALSAVAEPFAAADGAQAPADADTPARLSLHPSVRLLASQHAVLTIWRYATHPIDDGLTLPEKGEHVVLWRDDGEIAMAALDAASFACVTTLADGGTLDDADIAARKQDPDFDLTACLASLVSNRLVAVTTRFQGVPSCPPY